jgi:hypothetical protein
MQGCVLNRARRLLIINGPLSIEELIVCVRTGCIRTLEMRGSILNVDSLRLVSV